MEMDNNDRIEPFYLMIIVKYFKTIDSLYKFALVSSNCLNAINWTKINPLIGLNSIETALSNSRTKNIINELSIFPNIETLALDYHTLINMDLSLINHIDLIHVHKYVMINNAERYSLFQQIAQKIVSLSIDTTYTFDPDFSHLLSLKSLTLRVRQHSHANIIARIFNNIHQSKHLSRIIIHTDSSSISVIRQYTDKIQNDINVTFIIDWLYSDDIQTVSSLIHSQYSVGIIMNNLDTFYDYYSDTNVTLLPFINNNFQVSTEMALDKRFVELLQRYYPSRLEIQGGGRRRVNNSEGNIIDLSEMNHLEELFLNDIDTLHQIIIKVPSHLKHLSITKTNSILEIQNLDKTSIPQSLLDSVLEQL